MFRCFIVFHCVCFCFCFFLSFFICQWFLLVFVRVRLYSVLCIIVIIYADLSFHFSCFSPSISRTSFCLGSCLGYWRSHFWSLAILKANVIVLFYSFTWKFADDHTWINIYIYVVKNTNFSFRSPCFYYSERDIYLFSVCQLIKFDLAGSI